MQQAHPKPGIILVVYSTLLLMVCAIVFTVGLTVASYVPYKGGALIGVLAFVPLSLVLGLQQYRGTFRYRGDAAFFAAVMLLIAASVALFSTVVAAGRWLWDGQWQQWTWTVGIVGAICLAGGMLNLRWSRILHVARMREGWEDRGWRFTIGEFAVGTIVLAVTLAVARHHELGPWHRSGPAWFRTVAPFDTPPGATDASFWYGTHGQLTCEFTIDEQGFRRWIVAGIGSAASKTRPAPLVYSTSPATILRFDGQNPAAIEPEEIHLRPCLVYDWRDAWGSVVRAVYDFKAKRAYYYANVH